MILYFIFSIVVLGLLIIINRHFFKMMVVNGFFIATLSINDLKTKYAGSYLGLSWAFVQPMLTTFIYWFVFQIGFRSVPVENVPFILWLIVGLTPWFFFSDALISGTNVLLEYSYLVKKVLFKVELLPIIKIIAGMIVHSIFLLFVVSTFFVCRIGFTIYLLQVVYYSICLILLLVGLIYLAAAINVFIKDTIQFISVAMQLLFWMTPIVWDLSIMPEYMQKILVCNPFCYIVMGYRDAFINHVWFWEKGSETFLFWTICTILLSVGVKVYSKLSVHFADVL